MKDLMMLRKLANGEEPYGDGPFDADHVKLYRGDARELVDELDGLRAEVRQLKETSPYIPNSPAGKPVDNE